MPLYRSPTVVIRDSPNEENETVETAGSSITTVGNETVGNETVETAGSSITTGPFYFTWTFTPQPLRWDHITTTFTYDPISPVPGEDQKSLEQEFFEREKE